MSIEISCINMIWGITFLGLLALVGGTSAPKNSPKYKSYTKLLGFCILSLIALTFLSVTLNIFNTVISLTVVP